MITSPEVVADRYRTEMSSEIQAIGHPLKVLGFLSRDYGPSKTYATYTKSTCEKLGINFELREVPRLALAKSILQANQDHSVHGIMVYYPIFGNEQDHYIKETVDFRKDIEGLHSFWINKLYLNDRRAEQTLEPAKAVVPCTPLAIIKLLESNGAYGCSGKRPAENKTVTIFNRSEVVGRPLAVMMSNDGAIVYSFDEFGSFLYRAGEAQETNITRREALKTSNVVITGVPCKTFNPIQSSEINPSTVCLNFATIKNFDPECERFVNTFIPRVGPVTIAMCMRNTLRLYNAYHRNHGRACKD